MEPSVQKLFSFDPIVESDHNLDILTATFERGGRLTLGQISLDGPSNGVLCERPLGGYSPCPDGFALFFGEFLKWKFELL